MEHRDSLGLLPVSTPKLQPPVRGKRDERTFGKPDAFVLLTRLAAQWPYLIEDDKRKGALLAEFVAQFDGYDPAKVMDAATVAIGKATKYAPTAGEIKTELRAQLAPGGATAWRADEDHYRPNTPEEVERRKLLCQQWRKQYGFVTDEAKKAEPDAPWDNGFTEAEIENARALRQQIGGKV